MITIASSPLRSNNPFIGSKKKIDSTAYIPISQKSNQEVQSARVRTDRSKELYNLAQKVEHKQLKKRENQENLFDKEPKESRPDLSSERLHRTTVSSLNSTHTRDLKTPGKNMPR